MWWAEVSLTLSVVLAGIDMSCYAFNLEPRLPLIYEDQAGSYFGYSVAAHMIINNSSDNRNQDRKPRIIVGAPLKNNRGEVMSCDIFRDVGRRYTGVNHCERLPLKPSSSSQSFEDTENASGMWLGVSVSSGHEYGVLTCAHRFTRPDLGGDGIATNARSAQQLGLGVCFKYTTNLAYEDIRMPCQGKAYNKYHQDFGLCQAGTSCHLSKDFNVQSIGVPGAKTWRGAVYAFQSRYTNGFHREWVATHTDADSPVENYAYLGMSVTTGHFFDKFQHAWASGAPRANDTGAVLLFEKNRAPNTNELELNRTLVGEQVASSFGYVIAAVDINGDRYDDLIVGAPFYFEDGLGGAVYVFMNEGPPKFISSSTKRQRILGNQEESRFGFAITGMGDVDHDGFNDVAIGAPYEDDGAVYLFLGSSEGLSAKPSQIIRASDLGRSRMLSPPTTTFGYSLSGGVDLDNNKYPDLVIGAYASDRVFAVYARPIRDIKAELRYIHPIDPTVRKCMSSTEICTSFEVCLLSPSEYGFQSGGLEIIQRIEAETFLEHKKKSRVIFLEAKDTAQPHIYERKISLTTSNLCTKGNLILVDRSDIHNTIKLKLSLSIVDDIDALARSNTEQVVFIDRYPILNQKLGTLIIKANFIKNCGENEICESALHTKALMNLPQEKGEHVFYMGTEVLNISTIIENTGESAYDADLLIEHPREFSFIGRSVLSDKKVLDCVEEKNEEDKEARSVVRCDLGNPMENGERISLLLKFKPENEADKLTNVKFTIRTTTSSRDTKNQAPIEYSVNIVRAAELEIKGKATPEQVLYGGEVIGASAMKSEVDIGSEVMHVYSIFNYGPYLVPEFSVFLRWPLEVENMRKNGKYLLYLTDMPQVSVGKQTTSCRALKENSIDPLGLRTANKPLVATEAPKAAASRAQPRVQKKSTDPVPRRTTTTSTTTPAPDPGSDDYDEYSDYDAPERSTTARTIYSRRIIHERNFTQKTTLQRSKRDVIVPAESIRVGGRIKSVVSMRCGVNTRCVDFVCTVTNLKKHTHALISIKARLWNATFVEDYPQVDQVSIFSSAEVRLDPEIDIRQNTTNDYAEAETKAEPDASLYQRSEGFPLWAIILGVLIGILLLVAIVYCLYKYGFFKRNLPRNGEYQSVSQTGEKSELTQFGQYPDNHYN